jgi:hypothetical protein
MVIHDRTGSRILNASTTYDFVPHKGDSIVFKDQFYLENMTAPLLIQAKVLGVKHNFFIDECQIAVDYVPKEVETKS